MNFELWTVKFDSIGNPHVGMRLYKTFRGALAGLRAFYAADSAMIVSR